VAPFSLETLLSADNTNDVRDLEAGTTITVLTPGGGGYGEPADREAGARERDRADGKVGGTSSSDDQ